MKDRPNSTPTVRGICTFAVYFSVFGPLCRFTLVYEGHFVFVDKYDTCDKNLPTVLANSSNHSRARHNVDVGQCRMRVSNTFRVNVIFCPLKANTWRLKNKSCNRNEPRQHTNTRQIIEVSNSTKQHADNNGNHTDLCLSTI